MTPIHIDQERCCGDMLCVKACSLACIAVGDNKKAEWIPGAEQRCIRCGHCVAVCPKAAVSLNGTDPKTLPKATLDLTAAQVETLFMSRRSIRHFKPQAVDRGALSRAIQVASYAPTGANRRGVGYAVVSSPERLRAVASCLAEWMRPFPRWQQHVANHDAGRDTILRGAPTLIASYTDTLPTDHTNVEAPSYMSPQVCASACSYLEVVLHHAGVGTCWSGLIVRGAAALPELCELFGIPSGKMIYAAFLAGYPTIRYARVPWRDEPEISWL